MTLSELIVGKEYRDTHGAVRKVFDVSISDVETLLVYPEKASKHNRWPIELFLKNHYPLSRSKG